MAVTSIEIVQDNVIGDVNLMAAHNPLVFIARATWDTEAPEEIFAYVIYDIYANADKYRAIFYQDYSETERDFLFIADEPIRKRLEDVEEYDQSVNQIISVINLSEEITIRFDIELIIADDVDIEACNIARDFENENGATLVDLYNNESLYYVGAIGKDLYLYWYNNNAGNTIYSESAGDNTVTYTFNANVNAGEQVGISGSRLYKFDNPICGGTFSEVLTEGVDFSAGGTISDTVDNIIVAMQGNTEFDCFTITKNGTNEIVLTDTTNWFTNYAKVSSGGTLADYDLTTVVLNGSPAGIGIDFITNLADGETINFTHDDGQGTVTNTALTARNTPTLADEFQIGATSTDTMTNYLALFATTYPEIYDLFVYQTGDFCTFQDESFISSFSYTSGTGWFAFINDPVQPAGSINLDKGFIRKKVQPTTKGETTYSIFINGIEYSHTVKVREFCDGDQVIKYLDSNGQYRFMYFSKYYTRASNPESIGDVNELILSLKDDKGDKRKIGYNNNNTLTLSASQLNQQERALVEDLFNSPQVYLVLDSKDIAVNVRGDNVSRIGKNKFSDFTITIELPKSYNITIL